MQIQKKKKQKRISDHEIYFQYLVQKLNLWVFFIFEKYSLHIKYLGQ
jgi:hypothetical protein